MDIKNWKDLLPPEQLKKAEQLERAGFEVAVRRYIDPNGKAPSTYIVDVNRDDHTQFNTDVEGVEEDGLPMLIDTAYDMVKGHHPEIADA